MIPIAFAYDHDEYDWAREYIYEKFDKFSFKHGGDKMEYAMYFGMMYSDDYNGNDYVYFQSDIFVRSMDDSYLSGLDCKLDYNLSISYEGEKIEESDKLDYDLPLTIGYADDDLVYEFGLAGFKVDFDDFPIETKISLEYNLTSDDDYFSEADSYSVEKFFEGPTWYSHIGSFFLNVPIIVYAILILSSLGFFTYFLIRKEFKKKNQLNESEREQIHKQDKN